MPSIEPKIISKLPGWVYKARDAAEFSKHIPRNSPVSSLVHVAMGGAAAAGIIFGVGALMPEHDPNQPDRWDRLSWMNASRNAMVVGGAASVILTLGMQSGTPQHVPLARGINPVYWLGVGAAAFSLFGANKVIDAYEH